MTSSPADDDSQRDGTDINVSDLVLDAAARNSRDPALLGRWGTCEWGALADAVRAGAGELEVMTPGARVVLALPTGPDLAAALFATMRAGLVAVPVDPERHDPVTVARRVDAGAIVAEADAVDTAAAADDGLWRMTEHDVRRWWESAPSEQASRQRQDGSEGPARTGGEDIALLARAGRDRAPVMLSHRAVMAGARAVAGARSLAVRGSDRVLQMLPLFHVAGLVTAFLPAAIAGAAVVVPDSDDPLGRVESALMAARTHRVTVLVAEPTLYRQIDRVKDFDRSLASVRVMTSGSSPLDPADFAAMRSATGQPVREGYGISEAAAVVTSTLASGSARVGSVGVPYPGIEVRILGDDDDSDERAGTDEAGETGERIEIAEASEATGIDEADETTQQQRTREALLAELTDLPEMDGPDGDVGPIAIRGATVFSGYWPSGVGGPDADGWFVTGDIGYLDNQGELHLVDRAAETITIDGFTVYPREVEDVIATHPMVSDVVVVGLSAEAGNRIAAVLVPQPGTRPTVEDLREHVAERLASYKRPTEYELADLLPRTPVGRLDRDTARREAAARREGDHPDAPSDPDETDAASPLPDSVVASLVPERAAELGRLGHRLPADRPTPHRGAEDTDDDLF